MNNEYSSGLYYERTPLIARDEKEWTRSDRHLGHHVRMTLDQVIHLRLDAGELRMLDIVRGSKSRSEYVREAIERSTTVGGGEVAENYTDIPAGGTRRAAFVDAVRRMNSGDMTSAVEVYEKFVKTEDRADREIAGTGSGRISTVPNHRGARLPHSAEHTASWTGFA